MRIGMVSPLEMRVPPVGYGGTELIVSLLTEELTHRGHEVTLFASGDSVTDAELVSGSPTFLRGSSRNKAVLTMLNVVSCAERAAEFDIIHNHTALEGMSIAGLIPTPVLTTLHGDMNGDWELLFHRYGGWFNTISYSALSLLPENSRCVGVIHNAIDCSAYPFNPGPREDFLLYLSRISVEKGAHLAIEVARDLGVKLVIAGNVDDPDRDFFESEISPHVDGELIEYFGEADFQAKCDLLFRAHCLLAPITWQEPFGLFMVEAMACGTPVVAMRLGAVPEVIEDRVTGFVVDSLDEMKTAVTHCHSIRPEDCRARAKTLFDVPRMVDDYLKVYEQIIEESDQSGKGRRIPRQSKSPDTKITSLIEPSDDAIPV